MKSKSISQIIKENYSSLSQGQKKAAEFLTLHKDEGALLTAFQLGKKAGVSETTVIRLAYALGFKGYSNMQEAVRRDWLEKKQPAEEIPSLSSEQQEKNLFSGIIDKEASVLKQLLMQIDENEIWKAVDQLIQSDRIYIGGFGSSYGAACWLHYTLKQYRGNVAISSPAGFSLEEIHDLNQHSAVIIFSFPRYRKEALELAKCSQAQGSKVIAITNRQLSPVGQLAEITLTTEEKADSGHHSIASVVSLLEVIMEGVKHRDRDRISIRQQKLEQLYTDQGLFLE
ncbi:RpiR family transcriptional regulator [Bacillus sp. HMSC76G11]|uniref:MurR/RpiR family transcriptional regulator n=1 Tax=Metabacillus idriensis TaxID=324768 RepID=UPI0008A89747|nr:MurR/RpiR family transcriptional regulator [Metabacillus idriensis]OHR70613.1 RpiR family transcriptional regulator [Bacillus sp. HMSC76G11]